MGDYTPKLNLYKPEKDDLDWDATVNANCDVLDTSLGTEHNADGTHKGDVIQASNLDVGTGTDQINTDEIPEGTINKYVTTGEKTLLENTSGTNTGDQDLSGLQPAISATVGQTLYASATDTLTATSTLINDVPNLVVKNGDVAVTDTGSGASGISDGSILDNDCSSLTGWSTSVVGTANTPTQVTYDSEETIELAIPTATTSLDLATIKRTASVGASRVTVTTQFMIDSWDTPTTTASSWNAYYMAFSISSTKKIKLFIVNEGLWADSGDISEICSCPFLTGVDYALTIDVDLVSETYDIYVNGVIVANDSTAIETESGTTGEIQLSVYANGSYMIETYTKDVKIGEDLTSAGYQNLTNSLFIGDGTNDWRDAHQTATDVDGSIIAQALLHSGNKLIVEGDSTLTGDVNVNEGDFTVDTLNGYVGIGTDTPSALLNISAGTTTTAQIKLEEGALLTTPLSGTFEFANDRMYITNINTQRAIDRTSDVLLETVTVTNSTVETTLFTASIPANSAKVGNVFKAETYGLISTASSSDICTIRIKAGGVTLATIDNPGKVLTDECWDIKSIATIRSTGATGEVALKIRMAIEDGITAYCAVEALDLTASEDMTITAQWNNAKTGNTITIGQGFLEYKN